MSRPPTYAGPPRRRHAYALVSEAEYAVLVSAARDAGLSMSDFVRRCVNSYLLELGDDVPLLAEKEQAPRQSGPARNRLSNALQRVVGRDLR